MKKRILLVLGLAAVAVSVGVVSSSGSSNQTKASSSPARAAAAVKAGGTVKITATLSGSKEVPAPKGAPKKATGKFTGTLKGSTLTWSLSWSHLSGPATAAHIHMAATGVAGPVVVALCGKCKSPVSGSSLLGAPVVSAIEKGDTYVNVHTKKNPNGEIRGQLNVAK